ncbi:putative Zn-dependent protease [Rhodoblastus sphagnicola]|uniref:M48 family metalloprotease n=1 Tax=Rhodoblastus sphagnicola TaxID=333368 RepID=UPI001818DE17|nr:M48 family metalloprotease [Rhodoblastus sphagnicola]MBB4199699.1 putative Zn-dependent protease [Rhodoblastus sphagnicola]
MSGCSTLERQGVVGAVETPAPAPPKPTVVDTAERKKLIALFGGEYRWPKAENYLNDVLNKLARSSDTPNQPYRVTILNSGVINAFALPSGDLFVTRGMLALANDTAEIAAVMAHEIGHVTARHAFLRAEQEKTAQVITRAATVIQNRQKGEQVETTSALSLAGFSRQQELEADRIGIRAAARAGYDPFGAARFLNSLERASELRNEMTGQKSDKPDLLSTHPSTPERISAALGEARQIGAPGIGEAARAPYLAALDGMTFGDDPKDGAISGRRFVHPRLGFAFEAPEGFALENSHAAVLGVANGGAEALRLDSVRAPEGKSLSDYLTSGWIDGLLSSTIETGQVNGLPAVFADARAGEWNFRVAVIAYRDDLYRIIFAVKALTPEARQNFTTSIGSFRALAPEEIKTASALRLRIVAAGARDTLATLAARMAVGDHAVEQFEMLNEIAEAGVKPGDVCKIVAN